MFMSSKGDRVLPRFFLVWVMSDGGWGARPPKKFLGAWFLRINFDSIFHIYFNNPNAYRHALFYRKSAILL